jgi:hypothetical protein
MIDEPARTAARRQNHKTPSWAAVTLVYYLLQLFQICHSFLSILWLELGSVPSCEPLLILFVVTKHHLAGH